MSAPRPADDLRARYAQFAATQKEIQKREERAKQANPRGGLMAFISYFWRVIEPNRPFVEGWILEGLCEHLEAITRGEVTGDRELTRLLANISPGMMKSLTVNVFWPAWEWGPMELPYLRYIAFSYAAHLTERDNARFRDLVRSLEYKELWGHVFTLTGDGKIKVTNDKTGFKFASSVGGVGTGERADRVLCLPGSEKILTDSGWLPIRDVVEGQLPVKIAGLNHVTGDIEWQAIEAYERNPGNEIVEVACEAGTLRCTGDHPLFVQGHGYARADSLKGGEQVVWAGSRFPLPQVQERDTAQAQPSPQVLQQIMPVRGRARVHPQSAQPSVRYMRNDVLSASGAHGPRQERGARFLQPALFPQRQHGRQQPDVHRRHAHPVRFLQQAVHSRQSPHALLLTELRWQASTRTNHRGMESTSRVSTVRQAVLGGHQNSAILPSQVRRHCPRASHRREGQWPLRSWSGRTQVSARLDTNTQGGYQGARRQPLSALRARTRVASGTGRAPHRLRQDKSRPEQSDHALPLLPRQDARPQKIAGALETRTVRSVKVCGREDVVYNVRVAPCHNYFASGILVHNCDDPHHVHQAESDVIRENTVRWFRESMSNRLNSLKESAIVVIMQRVHELDVSGAILEDGGYTHYCVPMEYDSSRHCETSIGWSDPRTEEGELAWPERFAAEELEPFKRRHYLWAGQYQQSPAPRGGGLFKEAWWQVHEVKRNPSGIGYSFHPGFIPDLVIACLDTAFTEKEENDYSALTVWALFDDAHTKHRRILLVDAWKKRLELHGETVEPNPGESKGSHLRRAQQKWGLTEWVAHTCNVRKVNTLLIENKTRGHDVNKELRRLYGDMTWGIRMVEPKGDKWARAHSVVDVFTDGMIYAPAEITEHGDVRFLDWADMVIRECSVFPRGAHDDIVDTVVHALRPLRDNNVAVRKDERRAIDAARATHKGARQGHPYQV